MNITPSCMVSHSEREANRRSVPQAIHFEISGYSHKHCFVMAQPSANASRASSSVNLLVLRRRSELSVCPYFEPNEIEDADCGCYRGWNCRLGVEKDQGEGP